MATGSDVDFVSDLNGTGDATVSASDGTVSNMGADAVGINNQPPAKSAAPEAKPAGAEATDKPLSLRDQISSALKSGEDTPAAAALNGGPARDPATGKFAPAGQADPVIADPLAAPVSTVAAPQGIDPAVFQALPAETQAQLARTMDDLNTRQQRYASLEQVEQLIAPRRDAWALNGMTEHQALHQLLALSDYAGRDLPGFIKYMAQNGGVDLEALVMDQEPVDPKYAELSQQVQQLQSERTQEAQQRQQHAHQQTVDSVAQFALEKGPDGQPLRPYFDELGSDVLPFISAVRAQNPNMPQNEVLQEAYDRACWGSPKVRAKMQEATNMAADAERLRTDAEKVGRARNASASVRSGAPTSAPAAPDSAQRSLRDTIRASMAAAV